MVPQSSPQFIPLTVCLDICNKPNIGLISTESTTVFYYLPMYMWIILSLIYLIIYPSTGITTRPIVFWLDTSMLLLYQMICVTPLGFSTWMQHAPMYHIQIWWWNELQLSISYCMLSCFILSYPGFTQSVPITSLTLIGLSRIIASHHYNLPPLYLDNWINYLPPIYDTPP